VPKGSLNINAEHGVVVIRGEVRTPEQIRDIEQRVERIDGVQEVRSMLHLVNKSASSS
jgi:osmotically-inducible protein OsmY